ncbi:hypothetical protein K470DRAFT_254788 [Piedraia hortae CBS 480.64]|uniref:ornithine decarboxylase n=1 Tax=Piedraia hortae CBS 480.64 TaxID=1314780 RepID=A0A6A7C7M9_9PEZI|nr:hypothetical protein K470DRAFT_254788 [Piedraia hortae CBS 480.64]
MVWAALHRTIRAVDVQTCEAGEEDAFFVADLGHVYRQHRRWQQHLARVTPHYAVKCNPDPQVLQLLAALGAGFDCASKAEIEQVLAMGVDASRIIYAQPCKTRSYLGYTAAHNVRQMTFDNADELYKIKAVAPDAQLYLRILTDDSASLCRLSQKFGAAVDQVPALLQLAKNLSLDLVGVAFHVGSGASDPAAFTQAVIDARSAFDQAAHLGLHLTTLDVGGGFVSETFDTMADNLSAALDKYFPPSIRIIAEPGRFYTSAAFTLACNVIARRSVSSESAMLYLNDGVYGNFSCIMFDHQQPIPRILSTRRMPHGLRCPRSSPDSGYVSAEDESSDTGTAIHYSIWGPTCDGIDCISIRWLSSATVEVGDWLYFTDMGAYTKCSATKFNGFTNKHRTVYVCSEPAARELVG